MFLDKKNVTNFFLRYYLPPLVRGLTCFSCSIGLKNACNARSVKLRDTKLKYLD